MPARFGKLDDPVVIHHFALEIQGVEQATFREAAGFDSSNEVIEHREVDSKGKEVISKQPGLLKWSNISLKRGLTDTLDLYDWRKKVEDGNVKGARVNGSVVGYDQMGVPVIRYNFVNGWPCKWKGGDMNASNNQVVIEEIEIAHEGLKREKA